MSHPAIDLTGQVFGSVTVLAKVPINGKRVAQWKCVCACGKEITVSSQKLRRGHVRSCGCHRRDNMRLTQEQQAVRLIASRTDTEIAVRRLMTEYRGGAKKRGLAFSLTEAAVTALVLTPCHYCGVEPFAGYTPRARQRRKVLLNGIDRLDSKLGYMEGNVVSCCKHCNKAKLDRSAEAYIEHCRRVVQHQTQMRLV